MTEPGRLLARGRSADIYEIDEATVLRRRRGAPVDAHEPLAMELARRHGFPVPRVDAVDGTDIVMERLDGLDLLGVLGRRPWRVFAVAALLGDLHHRLAAVPPGDLRVVMTPVESVVTAISTRAT